MHIRPSHWAIFLVACSFVTGCEQGPSGHIGLADQKSNVTIKSVEIVEQNPSSAGASLNKLEQWKDSGSAKVSDLPVFDVVVMLQNVSGSSVQDGDLIALTTIESVIAPTYLYQGDVGKILQNGSWGRDISVDDVRMKTVPYVQAGEDVELKIGSFNLNGLLEEYNGQDHTLWPWGLKVNVHVLNREMSRVALGHATLRIIPADSRLSAK